MRTSTSVLVILLSVVIAMPRVQAQAAHSAGQSAIDAALQAHVKGTLSPHKYPRDVRFVAELPKTGSGKIDRRALREVLG